MGVWVWGIGYHTDSQTKANCHWQPDPRESARRTPIEQIVIAQIDTMCWTQHTETRQGSKVHKSLSTAVANDANRDPALPYRCGMKGKLKQEQLCLKQSRMLFRAGHHEVFDGGGVD